jgi:16S rRNA (uracil1498-N3)-methyltransferase
MFRLFIKKISLENNVCRLTNDEFHYLSRVCRLSNGEKLILIVDEKECLKIQVDRLKNNQIDFTLLSKESIVTSPIEIILFQCLPKGDKFSEIINNCTQLGCNKIIPVISSRSIVKLDAKKMISKLERWKQIAKQASQQSGQNKIVKIEQPIILKDIKLSSLNIDHFFVPWEEEKDVSLKYALSTINMSSPIRIGLFIGPEGGLSNEEVSLLKEWGGKPITLGSSIFRTEIASTVCISQINFHFMS